MSSYHLWLSWSSMEKIWNIPKLHITPHCHIWDCTIGLDSRMIVIEREFESSDTILIHQKKFSHIRTHPEELRAVKSKKCCYIHIISSKIYFSRRVVLQDEFLRYRTFLIEKYGVWAFKRTFNHDHSTIQSTCTMSYIAIRPYVEFSCISNFLQAGTRQQEMIWGHPNRIWKA